MSTYMVCASFTLGIKFPEGSKHVRADCGHMVYVAPAGQKILAESDDTYAVCMHCIPSSARFSHVPAEIEAELVEALGAEAAIRTITEFRAMVQRAEASRRN